MRPRVAVVTAAAAAVAVAVSARAQGGSALDVSPSVASRALVAAVPPLERYRATRHLEASARGGRLRASMDVVATQEPGAGFAYTVTAAEGSGVIRRKVFLPALEAERTLSPSAAARGRLTVENYTFAPAARVADGLVEIRTTPRRVDTLLIAGRLLVTEADGDLVSVEGALVKRPSFWTRHVEVVRRYARVAGVRVPVLMRSTADVMLVGRSTFEVTYEYQEVNGQAVEATPRGTAAPAVGVRGPQGESTAATVVGW